MSRAKQGSIFVICQYEIDYSLKFRIVFWDVLTCKITVDRLSEVRAASIIRIMIPDDDHIPDDGGSTYL
jgi:hypothetical protein